MLSYRIVSVMERTINKQLVNEWVENVGGISQAAVLIKELLECSKSKAEKIAGLRYPSDLTAAEQKLLARLWKVQRDDAFKPVGAGKSKAS